jgi:hypothetical protein
MNFSQAVSSLRRLVPASMDSQRQLDDIRINQGAILARLNESRQSRRLSDYEFKVFSQWGEDGIIQHLIRTVPIANRTFIEFGVEDFFESNCRFLLMQQNWQGFVLDGAQENIARLRGAYFYWRHHLDAVHAFITRENVDAVLARSGFARDLGILSIDLDGNDYYVLEAVTAFEPRILICEYNSVFGPTRKISVPYRPDFERTSAHPSNLYWGASLAALAFVAGRKGYSLVGSNSAGNNAFFVRNDLLDDRLEVLAPEAAYVASRYRESRDAQGRLTFLAGEQRLEAIRGLPVFEVERGTIEPL